MVSTNPTNTSIWLWNTVREEPFGIGFKKKLIQNTVSHPLNLSLWNRLDAARIIRDIVRAIAQCHSKNVVIRDVKPDNFLFLDSSEKSPLKAIDFGLAQYCSPKDVLEDRAGTPMYIAPEILRRSYGQKADMWSAGVIAYQVHVLLLYALTKSF